MEKKMTKMTKISQENHCLALSQQFVLAPGQKDLVSAVGHTHGISVASWLGF